MLRFVVHVPTNQTELELNWDIASMGTTSSGSGDWTTNWWCMWCWCCCSRNLWQFFSQVGGAISSLDIHPYINVEGRETKDRAKQKKNCNSSVSSLWRHAKRIMRTTHFFILHFFCLYECRLHLLGVSDNENRKLEAAIKGEDVVVHKTADESVLCELLFTVAQQVP